MIEHIQQIIYTVMKHSNNNSTCIEASFIKLRHDVVKV